MKRPRRYLSPYALALLRPALRYSPSRDAYVLRLVGRRYGPVLRRDRRRHGRSSQYSGPERRHALIDPRTDPRTV